MKTARMTMKKQKSEGVEFPMKRLVLSESLNLFSVFTILIFKGHYA